MVSSDSELLTVIAAPALSAMVKRWLGHLAGERRLAAKTVVAYAATSISC